MSAALYHQRMKRVLDRMGGLYTLNDILTAIGEGRMQSFVVDNSWAVTQVNVYPRAKALQIVAMVGDLADIDQLHAKLLTFAGEANCGLISAYGRMGWMPDAKRLGWRVKAKNYLYHREM